MSTTKKRTKYSEKKVIAAIEGTGGIMTEIVRRLGCSRNTLKKYLNENEKIKEAYDNEYESVSDLARSQLIMAIETGSPWAIMFFLDRKDPEFKRQGKTEIVGELKTTSGVIVLPSDMEEEDWEKIAIEQQSGLTNQK